MDWLPPYPFHMSVPAPVTLGPADAGLLFWAFAGPTVLGWTATYVLAIRQARADGRVGIPALMVAVDFAWEFTLTFVMQQTPKQRQIDFVWLLFDAVLLYQAFRYGRRDHPELTPRRFRAAMAGLLLWAGVAVAVTANEFHDLDGMYTGMIIQVVLSASFLLMLKRRGSTAGQSMYIAGAKFAGSLFAGLTGLVVHPHRPLFLVLVPTFVALDLCYLVRLRRAFRAEGRSPWAFRTRGDRPVPRAGEGAGSGSGGGQITPARSA